MAQILPANGEVSPEECEKPCRNKGGIWDDRADGDDSRVIRVNDDSRVIRVNDELQVVNPRRT